jgi:formamidopyrimidine-DNA glycosylase
VPELPEVETVRAGLSTHLPGRVVDRLEFRHPRTSRRQSGAADAPRQDALTGCVLQEPLRRGKYLWVPAGNDDGASVALTAHLGMSGQFRLSEGGSPGPGWERHVRAVLRFRDDGPTLWFVDQRTFGWISVEALQPHSPGECVPPSVAHVARDVLDPLFDADLWNRALRRRRSTVKRALLDQTLQSGVGNIYADEALWRVRLHPDRATGRLTRADAAGLLAAVREVMAEAIAAGGTSFDALYVNVNGSSGYFDRSLAVYGRAGEPCRRCGAPIVRERFANRSSHFCPRCQRRPRYAPAM